jgi:2'-5' RNA ligase
LKKEPSMPALLRAFVAVEIPKDVLAALETVQSDLRRRLRARWVRPGSMHLTLKFLGDIPAGRVASVADAVQAAAGGHSGFRLSVCGLGAFPSIRRPRVIWAGFSGPAGPLVELQRSLEERLTALGFPKEQRPFRGHLTIGRFSEPVDAGRMAEVVNPYESRSFGEFAVKELVLFQSDLQPEGPVYTALARARLKEA